MDPQVIDAGYIDIGKLTALLNALFGLGAWELDPEVRVSIPWQTTSSRRLWD